MQAAPGTIGDVPFVRHLPASWDEARVEFAGRLCSTIEDRVALYAAQRHERWVADPHASGDARVTPIIVELNPQTAHVVRCWFPGRKRLFGLHEAFIGGAWVTLQTRDERPVDHVCLATVLPSGTTTVFGFVPALALADAEMRMYCRFRADGLDPDEALQAAELILTPTR